MTIKNIGKGLVKFVVLPVIGVVGGSTLLNYSLMHNQIYETENLMSFTKVDGIIGHTLLEKNKDTGDINIERKRIIVYQTLEAEKGKDYVANWYDGWREYNREKDGLAFPSAREKADKDFRKQIKRFKPLMKR